MSTFYNMYSPSSDCAEGLSDTGYCILTAGKRRRGQHAGSETLRNVRKVNGLKGLVE